MITVEDEDTAGLDFESALRARVVEGQRGIGLDDSVFRDSDVVDGKAKENIGNGWAPVNRKKVGIAIPGKFEAVGFGCGYSCDNGKQAESFDENAHESRGPFEECGIDVSCMEIVRKRDASQRERTFHGQCKDLQQGAIIQQAKGLA